MERETEAIVAEIKSLLAELRTKGVSESLIDELVAQQGIEGKIILDKKGCLNLPDFGNARIRLNPMERTLYILVMRYPEGVPSDELWRFYDELCDIYGKQTVYDDPELIQNAIESICDDYKTTLYTNVSRIKKKLVDKLGQRAAVPYIITRDASGKYKIGVSRELVSGF